MNEHPRRPGEVAAAVLIGGVLLIALPRHAMSIVQLVIVTVSVVAGLYALAVNVPPTGWMSPFKWMSPFGRATHFGRGGKESGEIESIHRKLSGWRQPIQNGPPMPSETLRLLKPLIRAALDLEPGDDAHLASARALLSPLSWAVLTSGASGQPYYWFKMFPPNRREVAEAVHSVLDEVARLPTGIEDPRAPDDTSQL